MKSLMSDKNSADILKLGLILIFLFSLMNITIPESTATPTSYSFFVPTEIVEVNINIDGSVDIEYWITFQVSGLQSSPIDIVDIGLPNKHYKLSSVKADVDGVTLTDIRKSEVIDIGVEIHLHSQTITDQGTLHVEANQPYMIYEDSEESDMASCVFGNTWWDSAYTVGSTNLTTRIIFPTTVDITTYTKYHYSDSPDRNYILDDERIVFEWNEPEASPSSQYKYGVSFPKEGVKWITSLPLTGEEIFFIVMFISIFLGFVVFTVVLVMRKQQRLMDYVPPFVSVPTAGPRTDLKREEVAVLLEKPIEVTISMIVLSLIQKNLLKTISKTDPNLYPNPEATRKHIRRYERIVLESITPDFSIDENMLVKAITELVKSTQKRLKGYSYEQSVDHYERLIQNAVLSIKSNQKYDEIPTNDWYWAVLDEKFVPDLEIDIQQSSYYTDYVPWYFYYHYSHWGFIPRGRRFTERVTRISHPVPIRTSSGRGGGGGCACAGCACACAGGGR